MANISCITVDKLIATVPALSGLDAGRLEQIAQSTQVIKLSKEDALFREGDCCNYYYFIIEGSLRIQKLTSGGNELILYRLGKGQQCNLTNTCLLGGNQYDAEAIAETEAEMLKLPRLAFHQVLEDVPEFREVIFKNIRQGMNNLMNMVQEVTFDNMERRLAVALLKHAGNTTKVKITHQSLASELGTAREVVSRLLKEFERHGWVKLYRGAIDILDHEQLSKL